ncbi:glycosyltransferase [Acidisoma cellulosilytica]|uniref:Glycosyltransferase n=1 Tax=Acidisoma cellulosilyticum TaxID=2802395 RepID=A0A964E4K1_9PROT|nr:glycosyltransferase [Acidisoma cellulosilyticum]MCB8881058.1 glycosyltransferase [Acidisoma cellulosilyticum]
MKILFAFENALPSAQADAEVFMATAEALAPFTTQAWLHIPAPNAASLAAARLVRGVAMVSAWAPGRPAVLRHILCGLTIVCRRAFREADLVYTRNLWVAWISLIFGQRVAFDHYRPWPDQIPPLQRWLYSLFSHPRLIVNICHSDYTRQAYLRLGVDGAKLRRVLNGFEPQRLRNPVLPTEAKSHLGLDPTRKYVVYTGRVNHKKGLALVVRAAKMLPDLEFLLVGSSAEGPIEALARDVPNVRIIPFQQPDALVQYIYAADVLLIPPSREPLAQFGSTVLPLKVFFYLSAGRPILAGDTSDVREVLRHGENAWLCAPDQPEALVDGLMRLTEDAGLAARLAAAAQADSAALTWTARATRISSILTERLQAHRTAPAPWGRQQSMRWRQLSWRWLRHLRRTRFWILPPDELTDEPNG